MRRLLLTTLVAAVCVASGCAVTHTPSRRMLMLPHGVSSAPHVTLRTHFPTVRRVTSFATSVMTESYSIFAWKSLGASKHYSIHARCCICVM